MDVQINGSLVNYDGTDMALAMVSDITQSNYFSELDKLERNILEGATTKHGDFKDLLGTYLKGMEELHPGMYCTIFENRGKKLYSIIAPPSLSQYVDELDGVEVDEKKGPCGKAVLTKQKVISNNIQQGDFSARYKQMARRNGLKSCWSHPVIDSVGNVLAVFACYYQTEKHPGSLEQKTIERAVKILQVIMESKGWERALLHSNNRFELAIEATFDVIWDWDLVANSVYYSGNFSAIFGYEAGTRPFSPAYMTEAVHPDDLARIFMAPDEIRYGQSNVWAAEYRFKRKNGGYADVKDRAVVIRDEYGTAVRMVGALKDISERKREEHHLKLLESVVTNTNDAVLITEAEPSDITGPRILYVNEAFTKMTGYPPGEALGKTPKMFLGPKTDPAEMTRCFEAIRQWQPFSGEIINYKKNGEIYWKEFAVSPVVDNKGAYTHWIAIEHDVTTRKNEEMQKTLQAGINDIFNAGNELKVALKKALALLTGFGQFDLGEVWLSELDKSHFNLITKHLSSDAVKTFSDEIKNFEKIPGLNTEASQVPPVIFWRHTDKNKSIRHEAALNANFQTLYIVPLIHNNQVTGLLILGSARDEPQDAFYSKILAQLGAGLALAINRRQLEEELTQIFNLTPDILCIANIDGYFKKVNPAMCSLLEYEESELLSTPFMNFIHPLDKENAGGELQYKKSGHPSYYSENRYFTKSGKIRWLAWTTTDASEHGDIYCSAKDITDKKELEELLNKATRLARIGAWDIDLQKRSVHWSDMTREIHEAEPGFIPGITSASHFYREGADRDRILNAMEGAAQSGTPADLEIQITTAKGNRKWVRAIIEAEFSDGKCTRLYGSFQDIDDRKKAELAETDALGERNRILESIDDAFFAIDKDWTITYWNNRAEKQYNKSREEMLNRNLLTLFPTYAETLAYKKFVEAFETGEAVHFEYFSPVTDSWVETSIYPTGTGLAAYIKDVTKRKVAEIRLKELNESLQKQAKELAVSNDELEQFAYAASHDLQEPLRMVTSFMTQLENKYSDVVDERGRKYIYYAVDGAARMKQIILDLLEYSRIGKTGDQWELVDVNCLMDEVVSLYARQLEELNASVLFEGLPILQAHKTPLRQVFQNLIGNGLKYRRTGEVPVIEVAGVETADDYRFSVSDNGIGISSAYFDKIFIIFQRLHNKNEYSGTGMGLAITKKIIENLGGKIWLESEEGRGSTFYFTLPKLNNA